MSYSVIEVSNLIVSETDSTQGDLISNLKLQKLLYYCQGFFMAAAEKKLFDNPIEAWMYGPVVREVYFHFKDHGNGAISLGDEAVLAELSQSDMILFREILDEYNQFSAIKLMNMTHDELPWKKTWSENPQSEIPDELMIEYFSTQVE